GWGWPLAGWGAGGEMHLSRAREMQKFDEPRGPEENREHVGDPSPPAQLGSPATMLLLLLLSWAWGALAASPPLPPASLTLRLLQTTVFHNASAADTEIRALLGNLETHSMDCSTCKIRFLQPWAQRARTPKQWGDLELLIHRYLSNFMRLMNKAAKDAGGG
ncbi:CD1d2 antigen, partial [Chelydra serpentina]